MKNLLLLVLAAWITAVIGAPLSGTELIERALPPYDSNAPKRGLPFKNVTWAKNLHGPGSGVSWAYNWMSVMDSAFPSYLEFVPMLWDNSAGRTKTWTSNADKAIAKGTTHLLAFNEPELCNGGGTCMTPQAAVDAYRTYINLFAGKAYLGAPAVSNGPKGLPWLKEFLRLCTGCQIDFIPFHWYDAATNVAYLKWYIGQVKAVAGNRNLWMTEFKGSGTEAQQEAFLKSAMPWLDSQTYIARYAWFWCDPTAKSPIIDANNNPTDLGKIYAYA